MFLLGTMLLAGVGFGVILPTLPFLSRQLHADSFQTGLAFSVFAIAQLVASNFWGRLSDRAGRRRILIIGVIGYGVASALLAAAPNIELFLLLRFVGGFMCASIFPSAQALIVEWTEAEQRPRMLGYMSSMNGIGFIIGPSVGSMLTVFGYEVPFIGVGVLSVINGLLALKLLPADTRAAAAVPQERVPAKQLTPQQTGRHQLLYILPLLVSAFMFSLADASISSTLAYYFTDHLLSTATIAGWAFTINGAAAVLYQTLLLPWLFERLGERWTILIGFIAGAVGYIGLSLAGSVSWAFIWLIMLAGSRGLIFPTVASGISVRMPRHKLGSGMGWQQTSNSAGRTLGPLLAGWLFSLDERFPYMACSALMLVMVVYYAMSRATAEIADNVEEGDAMV